MTGCGRKLTLRSRPVAGSLADAVPGQKLIPLRCPRFCGRHVTEDYDKLVRKALLSAHVKLQVRAGYVRWGFPLRDRVSVL